MRLRAWLGCGGSTVVLVGAVVGVGWVGAVSHQRLVRRQVALEARWSDIENLYRRRLDLVPQLVETAGAVAPEAREILETLSAARAVASRIVLSPRIIAERDRLVEWETSQAVLAVALESTWNALRSDGRLEADSTLRGLFEQLEADRRRLREERKAYNEIVDRYNRSLGAFPSSVVARVFHLAPRARLGEPEPDG